MEKGGFIRYIIMIQIQSGIFYTLGKRGFLPYIFHIQIHSRVVYTLATYLHIWRNVDFYGISSTYKYILAYFIPWLLIYIHGETWISTVYLPHTNTFSRSLYLGYLPTYMEKRGFLRYIFHIQIHSRVVYTLATYLHIWRNVDFYGISSTYKCKLAYFIPWLLTYIHG